MDPLVFTEKWLIKTIAPQIQLQHPQANNNVQKALEIRHLVWNGLFGYNLLTASIKKGHISRSINLLRKFPFLAKWKRSNGRNALHEAAEMSQVDPQKWTLLVSHINESYPKAKSSPDYFFFPGLGRFFPFQCGDRESPRFSQLLPEHVQSQTEIPSDGFFPVEIDVVLPSLEDFTNGILPDIKRLLQQQGFFDLTQKTQSDLIKLVVELHVHGTPFNQIRSELSYPESEEDEELFDASLLSSMPISLALHSQNILTFVNPQESAGKVGEIDIALGLEELGIPRDAYETEQELRDNKFDEILKATPDFLFKEPTIVPPCPYPVRWIESKKGWYIPYLTSLAKLSQMVSQLARYRSLYGNGIIFLHMGIIPMINHFIPPGVYALSNRGHVSNPNCSLVIPMGSPFHNVEISVPERLLRINPQLQSLVSVIVAPKDKEPTSGSQKDPPRSLNTLPKSHSNLETAQSSLGFSENDYNMYTNVQANLNHSLMENSTHSNPYNQNFFPQYSPDMAFSQMNFNSTGSTFDLSLNPSFRATQSSSLASLSPNFEMGHVLESSPHMQMNSPHSFQTTPNLSYSTSSSSVNSDRTSLAVGLSTSTYGTIDTSNSPVSNSSFGSPHNSFPSMINRGMPNYNLPHLNVAPQMQNQGVSDLQYQNQIANSMTSPNMILPPSHIEPNRGSGNSMLQNPTLTNHQPLMGSMVYNDSRTNSNLLFSGSYNPPTLSNFNSPASQSYHLSQKNRSMNSYTLSQQNNSQSGPTYSHNDLYSSDFSHAPAKLSHPKTNSPMKSKMEAHPPYANMKNSSSLKTKTQNKHENKKASNSSEFSLKPRNFQDPHNKHKTHDNKPRKIYDGQASKHEKNDKPSWAGMVSSQTGIETDFSDNDSLSSLDQESQHLPKIKSNSNNQNNFNNHNQKGFKMTKSGKHSPPNKLYASRAVPSFIQEAENLKPEQEELLKLVVSILLTHENNTMLASQLGIEVKRRFSLSNFKLKNFLAQFPDIFHFSGRIGSEIVKYLK